MDERTTSPANGTTTTTIVGVLGAVQTLGPRSATVVPPSVSQRRLLAVLALAAVEGDRPVPVERLGALTGATAGSVRTTLSRLRRLLGPTVVTGGPDGPRLVAPVDATTFEDMARPVDGPDLGQVLERCDAALALWRGPAFEEFAHEPWARATALRFDELRLVVVERRADELVRRGRADEAVAGLVAHLDEHPLRDGARRSLMEALAQTGRVAESLRAYHQRIGPRGTASPPPPPELRHLERHIAAGWTVASAGARR